MGISFARGADPVVDAGNTFRPNLLCVGELPTGKAMPRVDGRVDPGEYTTQTTGMLNTDTHEAYEYANSFYAAHDSERFYMALQVQLPPGYEPRHAGRKRDDPALISVKDVFYLFIRADNQIASKAFQGVYLCVGLDGVYMDAWEKINWQRGGCQRDLEFNANWLLVTHLEKGVWTLELSVPWKDLRIDVPHGEKYALVSYGLNLQDRSIAWQGAPVWFDHYYSFGEMRFTTGGVGVSGISAGKLGDGEVLPTLELSNLGRGNVNYELTYLVSPLSMTGEAVNSRLVEQGLDVTQKENLRRESAWWLERASELKVGEKKKELSATVLKSPGRYLLEEEVRVEGKPVFYQKVPFEVSAVEGK